MKLHPPANRNASLEKASRVLAAFSEETPELGVMDLARRVGLNKSTASRFVSTLTQLGLLERAEGGRKVRLSLRLFELGMRAARNRPLVSEAEPILHRLSEQSRDSAWLATAVDDEIVFVSGVNGPRVPPPLVIGRRYPGRGAVGRLFTMASPPVPEGDRAPKLVRRESDVLVDHGELLRGVSFVAGAVFDRTGTVVGALGVATTSERLARAASPALISQVRRAAADLSRHMGFLRTPEMVPPPDGIGRDKQIA
ncbi:MAG: IclR family transcriptional regulator [Deltaproteobacteria bacterium]|nr:IclR family transcriptional regulator [Deltaproteobacteria bacterium]